VTTTAGSFNANYAYDVEDQNLAGGLDQATQNLAVSGNVYAAASITANTATTLNSGSSVLINNAAAAPLRATAYVDTYSISPGWTLNNLGVGSTIAPGAGAPTANVSFDDTGLLNNYVVTGTLLIMLENDQAITGTTNQDLGSYNWNLSHTVSGQTGIQAAPVAVNGAYDNLAGTSDKLLASIATLLDGDNVNGPATSVTMIWRDRVGAELPSGSPRPLVSDVADLDGTAGDVFVLQMNYDQGQASTEAASAAAGSLFLAWFDGSDWVNAIQGNVGTNTTNPAFLNYQGSWASSGAGLTLGAWGVDIANDVVWAVLDHNSEFAVEADVVPEPSTIVLVIAGIGMLVGACRCGRLNQRFGA
jgi:hypothetical protein